MIRAFLAIQPDRAVIDSLIGLQSELGDSGADIRWVSAEAIHLTVQFLGDVREEELPEIERGLSQRLSALEPFDIACRGLGVFPSQRRPRVLWVGLQGDGLARLADSVETVLSPLGFPPEEREFRPHITLGRLRSARGFEGLARILKTSGERSFGSTTIDHATLYKSQLRPDGAVHTPLATFAFAGR
jgi:RNA 2',3'-cyclic 3'-phosphodiesterase